MMAGSSLHVGGEEGHSSRPETVILAGTALEFSYSALDPGGELSISTLGGREKLMNHRQFPGPCRLAVVTGSHRWASLLRLLVNPTSYFSRRTLACHRYLSDCPGPDLCVLSAYQANVSKTSDPVARKENGAVGSHRGWFIISGSALNGATQRERPCFQLTVWS